MTRKQVSRAAIELIKRFEGYRRKAAQLPDGRWTIGYGHTLTARQGAEVSEADAEALLIYDLMAIAHGVDDLVYADLNANQFDALCAFAFSVGLEAFRDSDVLKRVNEGALIRAAFALELWRRAEFQGERIVIDALVRRRAAEKLMFLTPPGDAWRAVPSAVLRPELDRGAPDTAPTEIPAAISASLEGDAVALAREPSEDTAASAPELAAGSATSAATANENRPAVEAPSAELAAKDPAPRIVIDDTAPYEFVPASVQPMDQEDGDGAMGVVTLIFLGLAFLAGGIFWALNAPATPDSGVFTPLLVGWLAGVAGVGFIAAAIFMLLQRIARAADRNGRRES